MYVEKSPKKVPKKNKKCNTLIRNFRVLQVNPFEPQQSTYLVSMSIK
jgi:hypothetical protein